MRVPTQRQRRRAAERGVTLLEVLAAAAVLAIVILGVLLTLSVTSRTSRETTLLETARVIAQSKIEEIAALDPPTLVAMYGAAGGATFAVPQLDAPKGIAAPGLVEVLSEQQATIALGHPVDLDGDGIASEAEPPHAGFVAAVTRVTIRWTSNGRDSNRTRGLSIVTAPGGP